MPLSKNRSKTIRSLIDHGSQEWGKRVALQDRRRILNYTELRKEVRGQAQVISNISQQGDVIAMMMGNHLNHILIWLACGYVGRVQAQINTGLKGELLAHALNVTQAQSIILDSEHLPQVLEILPTVKCLEKIYVLSPVPKTVQRSSSIPILTWPKHAEFNLDVSTTDDISIHESDPLSIMFTSGTTGLAKGVLQPHGLPFSYVDPEIWGLVNQEDTVLVTLPQFHIAGQWTGVLAPLMVGGKAAIAEKFSVSNFWSDVNYFEATQTTMISAMVSFLMSSSDPPQGFNHSLRSVLMAPVTETGMEFSKRFNVQVATGLGQTESSAPVIAKYGQVEPGACGWVRSDFEIRVVNHLDEEVIPGETGELISRPLRPWSTMLEYVQDPEATNKKWRNLWLHSGDTVRQDATGQVFFVDRAADTIRRRGENVSSTELESVISTFPDVALVAATGVRSDDGEQEIRLFIVPKKGLTLKPEEFYARLVKKLPRYMVPRYVDIRQSLPLTPTERVKKAELRNEEILNSTWDFANF